MNTGNFTYPLPSNEPVLNYLPGSKERKQLKAVLAELKSTKLDIPMYIGGKEVRTTRKSKFILPMRSSMYSVHFIPVMKSIYSRRLMQRWQQENHG